MLCLMPPPTIDHDPNEPQRPLKGEVLFVSIATAVILVALGIGLKWIDRTVGGVWFAIACISLIVIAFALAFREERKKRQRRG